jgi:hypothetical protein
VRVTGSCGDQTLLLVAAVCLIEARVRGLSTESVETSWILHQ